MLTPELSATPELDKHAELIKSGKSQLLLDFLAWLADRSVELAIWDEDDEGLYPVHGNLEHLIFEYFDIDQRQLEQERRFLLEKARLSHGGS